jgi:hypothetical protein
MFAYTFLYTSSRCEMTYARNIVNDWFFTLFLYVRTKRQTITSLLYRLLCAIAVIRVRTTCTRPIIRCIRVYTDPPPKVFSRQHRVGLAPTFRFSRHPYIDMLTRLLRVTCSSGLSRSVDRLSSVHIFSRTIS